MTTEQILVQKRNSREKEPLNIEKIHQMVEFACEDITGVSASQVEMKSGLQFFDGISTDQIQQILIKSASDLISLETPNYQYVAARLLLFSLRKSIFRKLWDHPHLYDHTKKCVDKKVYDPEILKWYDKSEFDRMNMWIDHTRDYNFTYAGLRQVIDKYLVQDRSSGEIYETPQFMYMLISATIFAKYSKEKRMVLGLLLSSMLVVFSLILMILFLAFLVVIWLLAVIYHNVPASVLTLVV
jgi:ribonucleoside-diphosphate reductase alpha chain